MTWKEAISHVLAEAGAPMHYKDITRKILERKYKPDSGTTPEMTVSNQLTTNTDLFKKVSLGVYELVETSVTKEIDLDDLDWDSIDWDDNTKEDEPNYKKLSSFIKSTVPSPIERELLELIVNFRLPLVKGEVCFADILDDMEEVEFSDKDKGRTQTLDAAMLQKKLDELKEQIAEIKSREEKEHDHYLRNLYGALWNNMRSVAQEAEGLLANSGDKVVVSVPLFGEFVPGRKPKVVIYYENIKRICKRFYLEEWVFMAGVFVHEMFHAWNYFRAGQKSRSVLAIDEPMVEFETLYFLKELAAFTHSKSHDLRDKVARVSRDREYRVLNKRRSIGDVAAYSFGHYLFKNLNDDDSIEWIKTYSEKSASINGRDLRVKKAEDALIPVYPFRAEDDVLKLFKKIIFDGWETSVIAKKYPAAKAGFHDSLRDLVLACIETIGRKCFDAQELYAFAPIFKVFVPQCQNLESTLKQQLDELVKEGLLDALPYDCYSMK